MENPICFLSPEGGIDDRICKFLNNGYTKEDIAALRGLYQQDRGKALIDPLKRNSDISDEEMMTAATELMKYKASQAKRHLKEMNSSTAHMARTFGQLYHVDGWNETTRRNRINMIATDFTAEVSRRMKAAEKAGIPVSRQDITNGYKSNGQYHEGQLSIFESIFNKYLSEYSQALAIVNDFDSVTPEELQAQRDEMTEDERKDDIELERQARYTIQEYGKILNNWAALCTFARMSLRDTESLKLGNTLEYAAPTSPDNFTVDSPMEDYYDLEESVREAWMVHQAATSAFGSLGSEVRRFLGTIIDVDGDGNKITDDLGYSVKMNPVETHQYLADILRGITSESGMLRKLKSLSESDPKVKAIYQALAKASQADLSIPVSDANKPKNPVIITQLLEDMHKNMIPYTALVRNKAGNIIAKVLNRQANPLHDEYVLRMSLNERLDSRAVYDEEGNIDWEKMGQWQAESAEMLPTPNKESKNIFEQQQDYKTGFWSPNLNSSARIDYLVRASKALGINMDYSSARKIYNNPTLRKNYLTALQEFRTETRNASSRQVREALDVVAKYHGIAPSVSAGFTAEAVSEYRNALTALQDRSVSFDSYRKQTYGKSANSIGAGNEKIYKMLDILADVSENLKTERRVSWFDRKGKANSRYSDRTPSYMGDLVDKIHEFVNEEDGEGLRNFIMDKWGQSSFFYNKETGKFYNRWIQELYDSIQTDAAGRTKINTDALAKVFQFDEFLGSNVDKNVSVFENFTEKQHAEAMLKQFIQLRDTNSKSTLAKYPSFILGDSGVQMFFTARRYSKAEVLDGLKDAFRQEIEHQKTVRALNKVFEEGGFKSVDNYSETTDEFTTLTFLNPSFKDGKYWKILTKEETIPADKHTAMQKAVSSLNTDALTEALTTYMDDALEDYKHKLVSVGVLAESKGEDGSVRYYDANNLFAQNLKNYHNNIDELIEDFYWNTKYATMEQLQMFTVDPAFYDHRYPVKDMQKRYKEIYAPGKGISLEARDFNGELYSSRPYERVAYFDDISVSSEDVNPAFWKMLQETFKDNSKVLNAYKKNTLTDGQGYRTLESYRAVKGMAGEWTRAMEEAYNRIQAIRKSGRQLTEDDIKEIAQMAVVFQPIKPYMYTLEKVSLNNETGDMALIPVQHKYAEIVLIPELMKEGKLKDLALWMENHTDSEGRPEPIDMVASTKCVKVGAFGSVQLKGVNTTEAIKDAMDKAWIHNLSWSDYRIQSGVPEHLNHAQLFGTQIRKLILANINKGKDYNYLSNILNQITDDPRGLKVYLPGMGKVYLNGNNLISFYNSLIMANMFDSYNQFASQTATVKALSDKMIQSVISNSNQSEDNAFAFSVIEEGMTGVGEFVVPLGEPGMEHDASALLFSLFKKGVNKQKIKGGSAVQASTMGLSGYEDSGELFEVVSPEGDNVLYDEVEMPWNVSYKSATGKNVALRFEDWCNTDGTLKMSDKIVYGDEAKEYLSWPVSGRDKYGKAIDPEQGYYVPLIETKYKGVLDIIAYRIPTERDYSMINCKVFRFSNPLGGGVMKVPSSRTTTAGFDFDIDKLYFFMKDFAQTQLSDKQIEDIWNSIYALHPEWKAALTEARDNDKVGEKIFGAVASLFKDNMSGLGDINAKTQAKDRLYYYWESAGLEGTPEEAFTKYLEDHRDKYPVFDTYNLEISPLENTRPARNNMIMDLMRQRLMDKETLKARYTPGGFDNNRDAALRMRVLQFADKSDITTNGKIDWTKVDRYVQRINDGEIKDPEPEYDPSDPTAILVYNQQNQIAAKLIGIFANQNTNHVYASTMHELGLVEPIKFGNHTANGLSDFLHAPAGIDVDTNVAEYLAASVDAVKDPVLNFLNLNTTTADAGALLARLGYTPQEIGLLFNQPIIRDLCNYIANNGVSTDVAIMQMLKTYGGKDATFEKFSFNPSAVATDNLANNILKSREANISSDFNAGQLQVLYLFNEIMSDTNDLNSFVQATRFTAANSVGSTWGDQIAQEARVKAFIDKYSKEDKGKGRDTKRLVYQLFDPSSVSSLRLVSPDEAEVVKPTKGILNTDEGLLYLTPEEYMTQMSRNPLAFEQTMYDLSRKASRKIFGKQFPYYTTLYNNMRDLMGRLTKFGVLDADTINALHREFIVYALSKQKGSAFDGEAMNTTLADYPMSNREYYTKQLPVIIYALKERGLLKGIPFFNAIKVTGEENVKESKESLKLSINGMGGLQTNASNLMTEMWAEAAMSDQVVYLNGREFSVSQLAKDLYFYNFYHLGYNFHPTSFMSLAPTALKLDLRVNTDTEEMGYIDFINDVIDDNIKMDAADIISFAQQFILNHLDNKKFVFTPKGTAATTVIKKAFNNDTKQWQTKFTISMNELGKDVGRLFTLSDETLKGENMFAFRPLLALEKTVDGQTSTVYYIADAKDSQFNHSVKGDGSMTYKQVYAQGNKGQAIQYFSHSVFEAYQNDGKLNEARRMTLKEIADRSKTEEGGSPESMAEGTHIELNSDITSTFTDAQWSAMIKGFREAFPQQTQGIHDDLIRTLLSDTSDQQNVDILNDLAQRLQRGELKTIDKDGKEIEVCG